MSDEECDLNTLTALLGDSDEELNDDTSNNKIEVQEKQGEECDLEALTAFLEDSEDEGTSDVNQEDLSAGNSGKASDKPQKQEKSSSEQTAGKTLSPSTNASNSVTDIQAELLKMQQKMLELQEQLKQQQGTVSVIPTQYKGNSENVQEISKNPFFPDKSKTHQNKVIESGKHSLSTMNNSTIKTNTQSSSEPDSEPIKKEELFGDSDSDWDELDGEEKVKLNETGTELKNLLKKGEKSRISNVTKDEVALLRNKAAKAKSWKDKPFEGQTMVQNSVANKYLKENDTPSVMDPFSGIRIINPKVSTSDMKYKMQDRKLIKVSKIQSKLNSADLQGNWVTIGVVVHKSEPRTSANGKTYCIWKLSDLDDCDKTISFFLFGEVYKQHWKNEVRTVAGFLNPNLMDKAEKGQGDLAFTVKHPNQILIMGHSKDLGKCIGVSRAGKPCTNFINRQQGDYCVYHVQSAYKTTSSKRSELQGGAAVTPKNHAMKQRKNKDSFFFYQGETFTNMRQSSSNGKKDGVTLKKLQEQQARCGKGKITTMSLHSLDPEDVEKLNSLKEKQTDFVDMLTTPTVGAMNFVKHLVKKEKQQIDSPGDKKVLIQSVSATDLLKQHKQEMAEKRKQQAAEKRKADPLKMMPSLGKGCIPGGVISLDTLKVGKTLNVNAEAAKKLAISRIKEKGGIEKQNPNAVRKKSSPDAKEKIKKRALDNSCSDEMDKSNEDTPVKEPPRKRSKLLGNLDENSEEFKKLMKSKSKHTGALAEAEQERQEQYFMTLEKKEKYEEKMESTLEVKCTVFTCKQCQYTAFKVADKCKQENHNIKRVEANKRFFKCKKCGRRRICIQKYPTDPCKECGEYSYIRTSMHEQRKGPKLPHEDLSIRGDEVKYLGALNQKVFLNL